MTTIIRQLLDFARRGEVQRTAIEMKTLVTQTINLLQPLATKERTRFNFVPSDDSHRAEVDMGQLQQVLTNILVNAVQASPPGGEIEVTLDTAGHVPPERPAGSYLRISVVDHGEGIALEDHQQIFEPFFTTKGVGEGTGLGLSIAYRIVEEHGGWIDVESEAGRGATFRVYLPQLP